MVSWWVPCEIGVVDQMKIVEKIAIVSMVRNNNTEFKGNEYLKLYRCIRIDSLYNIKLFEVASIYRNSSVKDWLAG